MSSLLNTSQAVVKATEATDPKELLDLYQGFRDNMEVVNAIVQNKNCPDDIKKEVVSYLLKERLPRYAKGVPSDHAMLAAMSKSLEAWQPVQRLASTPTIDLKDKETAKIYEMAQKKGALILYGPPGTSKTFVARGLANALTNGDKHRTEFVQFHASYSYEDFIEGIVPKTHSGSISYQPEGKVFKNFCEAATKQASQRFVFIIDEINRADLSKVLGEVFTNLEYRGEQVHLLYSRDPFVIPSNVIIVGTMNTIDLSTSDLDFALRRRFYFFEIGPSVSKLEQVLTDGGKRSVEDDLMGEIKEAFTKTQAIYPLGHAYFKDVISREALKDVWDYQLHPLLKQYFQYEPSKVSDIERLYAPIWSATEGSE